MVVAFCAREQEVKKSPISGELLICAMVITSAIFGYTFRGRFVVNFMLDLTIIATLLTDFQSHTMSRT